MTGELDLAGRVRAAMEASEVVRAVGQVNRDDGVQLAVGELSVRGLFDAEVEALKKNGNWAEDWSRVRVAGQLNADAVRNSSFYGDVLIGPLGDPVEAAAGLELPSGIYNSTVVDAVVGSGALVRDVRLLARAVIGPGAVLLGCGSVTCDGPTPFGNGTELPVGLETGGREVAVFAEIDVELAARVARSRGRSELLKAYNDAVADYVNRVRSRRTIVGPGAVVRDTAQVKNVFVGPAAHIDGATLVADSTLLSNPDEPAAVRSGACVTQSIIQWGSEAASMAIVDRSVLTEHSHVERHGKVTDSIVGPNSGVAEGEATACLLGPFVGFHHQSLLIAAFWPEGKGNVGYGANVGSNHTSKAPDQEIWPGEGAFFGLGVNIKFPCDLSRAPYSIIASGVNTLPQKVTFPFSLINSPAASYPDISPAYNEIMPAWLLTDNIYTIKRNEGKYKARNKARRTQFIFDVFRPDTVDLMCDACRRLESVGEPKQLYTERDIEGLGKNYLLEPNRTKAIDAYRFYIRYYALLGLKDAVSRLAQRNELAAAGQLLDQPSDDPVWEHQRQLLRGELAVPDVAAGLSQLPEMLEKIARDVEQSKAKDDRRGRRIIDDYDQVHSPAAEDKFVRQTWEETRQSIAQIEQLLQQISGG